jgi:hypothetical protein
MLLPRVTDLKYIDPVTSQESKEPRLELFMFQTEGQIPTEDEYEIIAKDHPWKIFYERIRFENDDSVQRPLIFAHSEKDNTNTFVRQHFWFCIYDFQTE